MRQEGIKIELDDWDRQKPLPYDLRAYLRLVNVNPGLT
jgi:hypothetical protein